MHKHILLNAINAGNSQLWAFWPYVHTMENISTFKYLMITNNMLTTCMLETLSGKVMKIKCNFKKTVTSELEKCAEKCREEVVKMEKKTLTAGR